MAGFNVLPDRFRIRQLHERLKEKTVLVRIDIRNDLGCEQIIVETIRQSQIEKVVIPDHYGIADIPGMFAQQGRVDDRFLSCDLHVASFLLMFLLHGVKDSGNLVYRLLLTRINQMGVYLSRGDLSVSQ